MLVANSPGTRIAKQRRVAVAVLETLLIQGPFNTSLEQSAAPTYYRYLTSPNPNLT